MNQRITTLNLSKQKIVKLLNTGKYFCNDIDNDSLSSLSISKNVLLPPPTKNAIQILEEELLHGCILSFNIDLDKVLCDEIVPGRITEFAGLPGSGKTQICFQLSITTQLLKSLGGLEGQVIYITTNKNFASHRLKELIKKFLEKIKLRHTDEIKNFTVESILKHIHVFTCRNMLELRSAILCLKEILKNNPIKLLIIDSISSPLKEVLPIERTTTVYKLFGDLQELSYRFSFSIVITNEFTTKIYKNEVCNTPSFGESFFDRVNSRICLSTHDNVYTAELVKSVVKSPIKINYCMF